MERVFKKLTDLIGNTPLLELVGLEERESLPGRILLKLESFNPGGSVKDRAALYMIEEAQKQGRLAPGATIIEPTSGNTGIGLAWVARSMGYKVILTMPETMSLERRNLLKAYGAELVLTSGAEGMKGAIRVANELQEATPGSVILQQFDNPANPLAHRKTTAEEIWRDTAGHVDIVVSAVGTGGTLSGIAGRLKELKPEIEAIAVEPAASPVLSGGSPAPHKIQGIGAGFVPKNYDPKVVDKVVTVTDEEAMEGSRRLAREEGLLVGISSGAAFQAALREACKPENEGKVIVAIMPDTGERYLSTDLFKFE